MKSFIETLEFKQKCANYLYAQALNNFEKMDEENIHKGISEFCGLMEVLSSSLQIANTCIYNQSPVATKSFMKTLDDSIKSDLMYIEQFLKVNRTSNVFELSEELELFIQPIPKRNEQDVYPKKKLLPYIKEVKAFTDQFLKRIMEIFYSSETYYDQSWRNVDMHRSSFSCAKCGTLVTKILTHIGNLNDISLKEKEPYIPRLKYIYGHEVIRASLLPWGGETEITEDEVLIPIDSLYFGVKRQSAPGCCGSDSSVFNVYCSNGHAVGKEASDCWMPHFIRLPIGRIKRNEIID